MRKSKINLTKQEFDFVNLEDYPKIKQAVIQKLCRRFDLLGNELANTIQFPEVFNIKNIEFKTTRGENYQLMPYVVSDLPKIKGKDFMICCRTIFWWGHYFSLNVFVKADVVDLKKMAFGLKTLQTKKVKLFTGKDIWQQELSNKHFIKLNEFSEQELYLKMKKQLYVKLSVKVPFKNIDELEKRAAEFYNEILKLIK